MSYTAVMNQSADFWFYDIGVNVIAANTKIKEPSESWTQWQNKPMRDDVHESRKKSGHYDNINDINNGKNLNYNKGIAIIPGKLWRGPFKDKYLVAIDLDNKKAIEEFCRDENGLKELKQQTLVEQTSNPEKMHIYFIVEREIPNKASDKTNDDNLAKINANEIPALEVKSNGKGIMFCSYSPHINGSNYRIVGTFKPEVFGAQELENRIRGICDKHNIPYGFGSSNNGGNNNNFGPSIQELFSPGTKILEGHNRHLGILRVMDSLLIKNMGFLTLEQIKKLAHERNQELCVPPLDNRDMDRQWNQSLDFANRKKKEREEAIQKQQQQQQQQQQHNNTTTTNTTKTKLEKSYLIEEATRLLISKHRFLTIEESKDILYYDAKKGVYVKCGEILIEKELEKIFEFKLRTSDITEIKNHIMRKTYVRIEEFDANLDIINLKNGLYNWRTKQFFPHTPDYYSLNQKPIVYNPSAIPRRFIKFLREVLYLQDIRTAVELIAYTFIRKHIFQYYFILIGKGANGKNVFVGILSHLHGKENVSNVSLKSLVNERFALVDLVGKDINVDVESTRISDMSILKKLTDNQEIRVEQKGQPAFNIRLYAKAIFNANELPITFDNTDARFRREIIISFPRQFQGDAADLFLQDKITENEEEMSGIFNLVVNSLDIIATKNEIHVNAATISARRAKAKLTQDPIKAFLEEALDKIPASDDFETSKDMYDAFERFCNHHNISGPGSDKFLEDLKDKYGLEKGRKEIQKGKKKMVWYCKLVKWKNPDDPSQTTLDDSEEEQEGE